MERNENMKKKIILTILITIQMVLLTGCWSSKEINELGIVTMLTIDIEDGEIIVTAEVIVPKPPMGSTESGKKESAKYVQGRGKSLFEAVRNTTLQFDRRLYLPHNQIYILSEEFAREGLAEYTDFILRDHELRETAQLLVAKGGKAYELMGISGGIEELSGAYIESLVKNIKFNSKAVSVTLTDYMRNYYDVEIQPVLGKIEKKEMTIEKIKGKKEKTTGLTIEGASVFNRGKLVGFLNGDEIRGYNFVRNKIQGGVIEFPTPQTSKARSTITSKILKGNGNTVVEITRSKTKNDIEVHDGKIILKTQVKITGMLGEETGNIDTSNAEALKLLEKSCSNQVKRQIEKVIKKVQDEYSVDIFGYGKQYHRKDPKEWNNIKNNWDDIFAHAEVLVDVNTEIVRTGLVNKPSSKVKGK